jgi:hypothetical protein
MTLLLSGTSGLSDVDGSASTPAIRGTDTNTGIFFPAADTIAFAEGGTEVARFDSSGNLGVGTSSPAYRLDISGGHSRIRGAQAQFWSNSDNTNIVGIYNGAAAGSSASSGQMVFETGLAERMRINSGGDVFIGSSTYPAVGNEKFGVSGGTNIATAIVNTSSSNPTFFAANTASGSVTFIRFASGSGGETRGNITYNGSNVVYGTSSDYRLKENIAPMTGALAVVGQLKPCSYTCKETGIESQGFIAHELAEVCPDAVVGEKDAVDAEGNPKYQGIDTSFLVATLTAAIQELKAEFDEYKRTHP